MAQLAKMRLPASAKKGEWVTVKTLVAHPQKVDKQGHPEHVLTHMKAVYDGKTVVEFEMGPGIGTSPQVAFRIQATKTGDVTCLFVDNKKQTYTATGKLNVT